MLAALGVLAETPGRRSPCSATCWSSGQREADGHRAVGEAAARVVDGLFTVGPRGRADRRSPPAPPALRTVRHFDNKEDAAELLRENLGPGDIILIKGSHGLRLDAVVAELQR